MRKLIVLMMVLSSMVVLAGCPRQSTTSTDAAAVDTDAVELAGDATAVAAPSDATETDSDAEGSDVGSDVGGGSDTK